MDNGRSMRSAYVWNTAGSMLNAFQSVIMLMVITRVCDLVTAGVFTLAYANANLFLTLGVFGMRNYEASDVEPRFSFGAYGRARAVTGVAMVACSWLWLAWSATVNGYAWDKILAVALMTLMKGVDAIEDVFDGSFQQSGRLDVAGRLMTFRVGTTIIVFCVAVVLTADLVLATGVGFVWTISVLVTGLAFINRRLGLPLAHVEAPVTSPWRLLAECLPLFIAAFLSFYVGNAPKYAIDAVMGDAEQAVYGFIAMPVFVVGLLSQFIYMPLVQPLSDMWAVGDRRGFVHAFARQIWVVVGITAACVTAAAMAGPLVLGWLYACDLTSWRGELCMLVAGGGVLALSSLFTMGITIMRAQRRLVVGYVAVALYALLVSGWFVGTWGIVGAAVCYMSCMVVLATWFGAVFTIEVGRAPSG